LDDISLFIHEVSAESGLASSFPSCAGAQLNVIDLSTKSLYSYFSHADLSDVTLTG